jgi:ATP-dependent RNA helicase DOB1
MEYKGFTLDDFQIQAIESVNKNHSVVVSAPTGSGKTLIADFIIDRDLRERKRVIYTAPIKALSNQKYNDFSKTYGKDAIGLMTGDEVINPTAQVLIMTTEIYRNMVLVKDASIEHISYVIFDEIHYINDVERGYVWEESVIFSPENVRFLCLSATIPNAEEFANWIRHIKNHEVDVIHHDKRSVPLELSFYEEEIGITTLEHIKNMKNIPRYREVFRKRRDPKPMHKHPNHLHLVQGLGKSKMPILFFCFSRMACQKNAGQLAAKTNKIDYDIKAFMESKLKEVPKEISSLKTTVLLKEVLPKGIAFHHAGLIPVLKEIVETLFSKGKIDVLYVTETFAVGINMPAKTVCFEDLRKYNGISFGFLTSKEFFQMAGRAGRRGMDKVGYVVPMIDYRNFEYGIVHKMTTKDTEPLQSQFKLSTNTVLNLIARHSKEERAIILQQSFFSFQKKKSTSIESTYANNLFKLKKQNYLTLDEQLTRKGIFASKIFCDEIPFTEIFASDLWKTLTDYEIVLLIASMVFEERRNMEFFGNRKTSVEKNLFASFNKIMGKQAKYINDMSSIVYPIFAGKTFFEMLKNTSMDEGDLMRLFSQILDRLNQLMRAADEYELREKLSENYKRVKGFIKDIY